MLSEGEITREELRALNKSIYAKANRFTEPLLALMFLFGLFIAQFYDTWTIALGVGGLNVLAYISAKKLLPQYNLYQYVFSAVSAIFAAQYIYQMHGLAEMHFWVFISSTILIIYQNWKLQLPLIIIVIIHHGTFAYLQFQGYSEIYFTQLDYMDLTAFIFHGVLASCVCLISGIWGYNIHKRTITAITQYNKLEQMKVELEVSAEIMKSMNDKLMQFNHEVQNKNEELRASEEELMASGEELKQINENLNQLVIDRTKNLVTQNNVLIHHAYISAHKVRAPLARILGLVNLMNKELHLQDKEKDLLTHLNTSAEELDDTLREVRESLDKAEFKESDKLIADE
jgi:signal transduction histidine kinase